MLKMMKEKLLMVLSKKHSQNEFEKLTKLLAESSQLVEKN